jgi:hypothetical protein
MYNASGSLVGGLAFNSGYTGFWTGAASTRLQSNGTLGISTGTWNHIALVYPDTNAKNAKLYVNGTLRLGAANANDFFPGLDSVSKITSPRVRAVGSTGGSGDTAAIAVQDALVTNRALTKEEIAKKARYRFGDTDLYTKIWDKAPYVWYKLDNLSVGNPSVINSGEYFSSPDYAPNLSSLTYNVAGIEGGEGIRNTFLVNPNGINVSNSKQGIREAIWNPSKPNTAGFSIEWWQKTPAHNPTASNAAKTLMSISGSGGARTLAGMSINTGSISAGATSMIGVPNINQVYISGTTGGYQTGSLATTNTDRQYINYADGQWHHFVYTFNYYYGGGTSATLQNGVLYVDGEILRSRQFTANGSAYGNWSFAPTIDPLANYVDVYISGVNSAVTDDGRYFTFDNFVFYNAALNNTQVRDNYYAWVVDAYPTPPATGAVKYWDGSQWVTSSAQKVWNGTAWVDWSKSYWNGNSWITV